MLRNSLQMLRNIFYNNVTNIPCLLLLLSVIRILYKAGVWSRHCKLEFKKHVFPIFIKPESRRAPSRHLLLTRSIGNMFRFGSGMPSRNFLRVHGYRNMALPFICVGDLTGPSNFGLFDGLFGSLGPIPSWCNCFFGFKTVYFVLNFSKSAARACFGGPNVTFHFITICNWGEISKMRRSTGGP